MKIRQDFVTNSSSSSFLISKRNLDDDQIEAIRNNGEMGRRLELDWADDSWEIEENDQFITGYTIMDNYYISELFDIIGINGANVTWGEHRFDISESSDNDDVQPRQNNKEWRGVLNDIQNGVSYTPADDDELSSLIEELEG